MDRVKYIDALRGIAMLFVVYGHINYFSFSIEPFIYSITEAIQMPLFFFISGYVIKPNINISFKNLLLDLYKKFRLIVIPSIAMGLIYSLFILDKSIVDFIFETMKYGYWFTFSLFTMLFIYKTCEYCFRENNERRKLILLFSVTLILWCLKYAVIKTVIFRFLNETICLWQTLTYFPFFVFGVALSMNKNRHEMKLKKMGGGTMLFIAFIASFYLSTIELPHISFPLGGTIKLILGISGTLLVLQFVLKYKSFFEYSKMGELLQLIGQKSLAIYLLHYLFLPNLISFSHFVDTSSTVIGLSVALVISILVVMFCLIAEKIINLSPFFATYLLGTKIK